MNITKTNDFGGLTIEHLLGTTGYKIVTETGTSFTLYYIDPNGYEVEYGWYTNIMIALEAGQALLELVRNPNQ